MTIKVTCRAGLAKRADSTRVTKTPASRIARMLALAFHIDRLIESGEIENYAAAARLLGVSRARLTQIMGLLGLAPVIQEAILTGELAISERRVRTVSSETSWEDQGKRIA